MESIKLFGLFINLNIDTVNAFSKSNATLSSNWALVQIRELRYLSQAQTEFLQLASVSTYPGQW